MSMIDDIYNVYRMSELFSRTYYNIGKTRYKSSSTKSGNNPKAIKARRKKNKNKKTHRK